MVLRMKKVNNLRVHWKIRLLGEGSRKTNMEDGAWQERGGGVSEGGVDTPMHTMRVVQNLRRNLLFVSKMTRICWILIWALKSLKYLHFDKSLLRRVYNIWPKKYKGVSVYFMTLKSHAKFEEKLTCGLGNDVKNSANFHQNT